MSHEYRCVRFFRPGIEDLDSSLDSNRDSFAGSSSVSYRIDNQALKEAIPQTNTCNTIIKILHAKSIRIANPGLSSKSRKK